jgi:hypothetical protein
VGAVPAGLRAVQRGLRPHAACWWRAWLMDSWLARSLYRASPRLRARTGGVSREGVRLHTPPPPVAVGVGQAARRPPGQLWSSNRERQKSWRTAWLTFRCRARATCRPVLLLPPCVRLGACRVRRLVEPRHEHDSNSTRLAYVRYPVCRTRIGTARLAS